MAAAALRSLASCTGTRLHPGSRNLKVSCAISRFSSVVSSMEDLTASTSRLEGARAKAVVLYHYPCPDGAFAALAAYLYHSAVDFPALFLPNTVYRPIRVEELQTEGVDIFYLLDFSGPDGFAVELSGKAKQVVILDHHKTALEMLPHRGQGPPNLHTVLDMNRSGAIIAYDHFMEKLQSDRPGDSIGLVSEKDIGRVKTLFKYVEDADLWTWALSDSKAFSSGLKDAHIEFSATANPSLFDQLLALDPAAIIENGKQSLSKKQTLIDHALATSFEVQLGGGRFGLCLGVRADEIAELRSELGNQLAAKSLAAGLRPIGAVVYVEAALNDTSRLKISLRSIGDADDTTEVSQAYGGGGHRNASAFLVHKDEFQQWQG